MYHEMINTHEVVKLFHHFMMPSSRFQVLRLVGEAKMGKTHLLTKVFPIIAEQEYQAHYAVLDLRNQIHAVPDILHMACGQLGARYCEGYYAAHLAWTNRLKVGFERVLAIFSYLNVSNKDTIDEARHRDRYLTAQFVNDLGKLDDKLILLLFDSIDNANDSMQTWLMDMLMVQLTQSTHIRIVMAGRSLPEPHGSYAALCQSCKLLPVTEEEAYITFCQSLNITLAEQSIRDFAYACDYKPGIFVDFVSPKFSHQRLFHG